MHVKDLASPAGSANVDWLGLQNIGGTIGGVLANNVMRVDTYNGQPPASVRFSHNYDIVSLAYMLTEYLDSLVHAKCDHFCALHSQVL